MLFHQFFTGIAPRYVKNTVSKFSASMIMTRQKIAVMASHKDVVMLAWFWLDMCTYLSQERNYGL